MTPTVRCLQKAFNDTGRLLIDLFRMYKAGISKPKFRLTHLLQFWTYATLQYLARLTYKCDWIRSSNALNYSIESLQPLKESRNLRFEVLYLSFETTSRSKMVPRRYLLLLIAIPLIAQSIAIPAFPIDEREQERFRLPTMLSRRVLCCGLTSVRCCGKKNSEVDMQ